MAEKSRIAREIVRALGDPRSPSRRPAFRRGASIGERGRWRGSRVQSLLFDVASWTPGGARRWARSRGYRGDDVHVTARRIRLRQRDPDPGRPKRTITFGRGIQAVVEAR